MNHTVEVKLTDKGRDIYLHKDDWMVQMPIMGINADIRKTSTQWNGSSF